jgi:hypothetical protein
VGQSVWYFFEVTGINAGTYEGAGDDCDGLPTFGGPMGFLGGDVTHWAPRREGDLPPPVPDGYSKAERALVHGGTLPFDCPDTWANGTKASPATAPQDWAHAAARGVFQSLYEDQNFRMTMRETPAEQRAGMVARAAAVIRVAAEQGRGPVVAWAAAHSDLDEHHREFTFNLSLALADPREDPNVYIPVLRAGDLCDAALGVGRPGRLGVMCTRSGPDEQTALAELMAQIQKVIPGAQLIGKRSAD